MVHSPTPSPWICTAIFQNYRISERLHCMNHVHVPAWTAQTFKKNNKYLNIQGICYVCQQPYIVTQGRIDRSTACQSTHKSYGKSVHSFINSISEPNVIFSLLESMGVNHGICYVKLGQFPPLNPRTHTVHFSSSPAVQVNLSRKPE